MFLAMAFSQAAFSQEEIKLSDIRRPGNTGLGEKPGLVLAENLIGPYKVVFSGNSPGNPVPVLSREETGIFGGKSSFDKLAVLFSGKVYSPLMAEPILFIDKTPEELVRLEIMVFPSILEQPYALFLDLKVQAASKTAGNALSDDAGHYAAFLNVGLIKL